MKEQKRKQEKILKDVKGAGRIIILSSKYGKRKIQ